MSGRIYAAIRGAGHYVPERVLTNDDLSKFVETDDEWIRSRTGIAERRLARDDEYTSDMATAAARRADLIEHPFDEAIRYSEDVEWAHRRPIRIAYAPEAKVEHSHNYTLAELKKRFFGEGAADAVIFGLQAILTAVGAPTGYIVIEDNKPDAIELMTAKTEAFGNIEVVTARTKYPQGAEKMLIKRVLGRKVPSGGLPADVGAVVSNVSTAKAICDAIKTGMPLIERVVTVTGERIAKPGNYIVKVGTSVKALIDYCAQTALRH